MSTNLYGVRILDVARDERRVRLRVFVVYYDTDYTSHQPIPTDRSFFVRVLSDKQALCPTSLGTTGSTRRPSMRTRSGTWTGSRSSSAATSGDRLLISTDAGGVTVFDTDDISPVLALPEPGDWRFAPGWTTDGRVLGLVGGEFVARDPSTGARHPFTPFGVAASGDGARFVC